MDDLTARFAEQLLNFDSASISEDVRVLTKRHLLDLFGAMLAASSVRYPIGDLLLKFVEQEGGSPRASVVGRSRKTSITNAALTNGTFAYYCDIEPHHPEAVLHAPAAVVPAVLAVGEAEGTNGESFLTAVILGIDVACRLSQALDPRALYARGFHPTAVAGVFGAMAGAGKLLKLDAAQWVNAVGLAALETGGLLAWASDPTEHSRPFNVGLAAHRGASAAMLASMGFGGPRAALSGKANVFDAFSGVLRAEYLTLGRDSRFAVAELATKLYACCAFLHPGLDALLKLLDDGNITVHDIDSIDLHFPRSGASIIDGNSLRSHCAQYVLPVAALHREVQIDHILFDQRQNPEISRLYTRVRVIHDRELDEGYPQSYTSILVLKLRNGEMMDMRVDIPKGHPANPLTPHELQAKYLKLSGVACSSDQAALIESYTMNIDHLEDVKLLGDALRLS